MFYVPCGPVAVFTPPGYTRCYCSQHMTSRQIPQRRHAHSSQTSGARRRDACDAAEHGALAPLGPEARARASSKGSPQSERGRPGERGVAARLDFPYP